MDNQPEHPKKTLAVGIPVEHGSGRIEINIFDLGKLFCDRGDFSQALKYLNDASREALATKDFELYLKCIHMILRINVELDRLDEINVIKESLQDLVLQQHIQLTAKTYYTLGACSFYRGQHDSALVYWQKSYDLATNAPIEKRSVEDICNSILGFALIYTYSSNPDYEKALSELDKLDVIFTEIDSREQLEILDQNNVQVSSDVRGSAIMIRSRILRLQKKYEESLSLIWTAYENYKNNKHPTLITQFLDELGGTYLQAGELELAKTYLTFALKTVDRKNQVRLTKVIQKNLNLLREKGGSELFDLVLQKDGHSVQEREKGLIDFKNQFILMDLLKMFARRQGEVITKEVLAQNLWGEKYTPGLHDNKIYVTVRRLRSLIEPDEKHPKYIFRSKMGYYINNQIKIAIESNNGETK